MVKKYQKNAMRVMDDPRLRLHPHSQRAVIVDNEVTPVDTYEDTAQEKAARHVEYVGFTTYVKADEEPPKMGGFSAFQSRLAQQKVAGVFLDKFRRAGYQPQPNPEPAPQPEPSKPVTE